MSSGEWNLKASGGVSGALSFTAKTLEGIDAKLKKNGKLRVVILATSVPAASLPPTLVEYFLGWKSVEDGRQVFLASGGGGDSRVTILTPWVDANRSLPDVPAVEVGLVAGATKRETRRVRYKMYGGSPLGDLLDSAGLALPLAGDFYFS